jgi:hypothetical protein
VERIAHRKELLMSYRNHVYYVDHFKKMTPDEAYELVMHNLKRPGYAFELDCAKRTFDEIYNYEIVDGVKKQKAIVTEFISPEERKHKELIAKNAELEAKIAEKETVVNETDHTINTVDNKKDENPVLTKAEFKERFCKALGYGSEVTLSSAENMACGRAWKKYPYQKEE